MSKVNRVFDIMLSKGFLIGSRAYGGFTSRSDWDLVIDENIYAKILVACANNGIKLDIKTLWGFSDNMDRHNMFNTLNEKIYFPSGNELNILAYRNEDMQYIREVHEAMTALVGTAIGDKMAKDKAIRIEVFQALKNSAFKECHYCMSKVT
jgi:hypothetical protein